jgi:hypothetical protein
MFRTPPIILIELYIRLPEAVKRFSSRAAGFVFAQHTKNGEKLYQTTTKLRDGLNIPFCGKKISNDQKITYILHSNALQNFPQFFFGLEIYHLATLVKLYFIKIQTTVRRALAPQDDVDK